MLPQRATRQAHLTSTRSQISTPPSIASYSHICDPPSDLFDDDLNSSLPAPPSRSTTSCASSRSYTATPTIGTLRRRSNKDIRHSWVFKHMPDEDSNTRYHNQGGFEIWKCFYCPKIYRTSGGTTIIMKHLIEDHEIPDNSPRGIEAKRKQFSLEQAEQIAEENPQKRRKLNKGRGENINPDILEVLYTNFITACNLPLRLVECNEFRDFLNYLNPETNTWLPKTHDTIKVWVLRQYGFHKEKVRDHLHKSRSKIHISCDLWTSPNSKAILGIFAHYISEDGHLRRYLLAMKELLSHHTSEDEAPYLMAILKDYGIVSKLGYFVMDNDATNDKMLRVLSLELEEEFSIKYDAKHHRIRCQGHILNLAAQSFLFVTNKENLENDSDNPYVNLTMAQMKEWRKKGPLGKLHNVITWLFRSIIRLNQFLVFSRGFHPARDNSTRWNSWEAVLSRANSSPVHEAFAQFFEEHPQECIEDQLTDSDWEQLRKIQKFLKALKQATLALEGHEATLNKALPTMDYILDLFEKAKREYADDPFMLPMINSGWAKLTKYYKLSDQTPAYVAAIVLSPHLKWRYIENNWREDWIPGARVKMEKLWDQYKAVDAPVYDPFADDDNGGEDSFHAWFKSQAAQPTIGDEYVRYCALPQTFTSLQAYQWWLEPQQQTDYPYLSKLALDILSIPGMSDEPERLFSDAKLLLTDRRNRMGIEIMEAIECLKSWLKIKEWSEDNIGEGNW